MKKNQQKKEKNSKRNIEEKKVNSRSKSGKRDVEVIANTKSDKENKKVYKKDSNEKIEKNKSKLRISNIELLRIISMLMIICYHFSRHGKFSFAVGNLTLNRVWLDFFYLLGKLGVNIFVLISGYFLIEREKLSLKKVLKLWLQISFYNIAIFIIFYIFNRQYTVGKPLKMFIFPITFNTMWFASTYFVMFLLSPYINKFLNTLKKGEYKKFLIITNVLFCLIPTLSTVNAQVNNLIWFINIYAIAGYIRKYKDDFLNNNKKIIISIISIFTFCILFSISTIVLSNHFKSIIKYEQYFSKIYYAPLLLLSILIFKLFLNQKPFTNKFINILASATFGVYLIHDYNFVRRYVWLDLLKVNKYKNSPYLILYSLGVVLLIYIICSIIELLRIYIIEKRYINLLNKISLKLEKIDEKISNRFCLNDD